MAKSLLVSVHHLPGEGAELDLSSLEGSVSHADLVFHHPCLAVSRATEIGITHAEKVDIRSALSMAFRLGMLSSKNEEEVKPKG